MTHPTARLLAAALAAALTLGLTHALPAQDAKPAPRPTLRQGDSGAQVEALQRVLNARLKPAPGLDLDGDFGAATLDALRRFQREKGLKGDGVADAATWAALGPVPDAKADAVPPPAVVNARRPKKKPAEPLDGPPFVTAKAWVAVDGRTGAVLGGSHADEPLDMASTTKMMTALVVLGWVKDDPKRLEDAVVFSERADKTPGSTAGVKAGERLPLDELLYGLLLPSGNDASVALAEHVGKTFEGDGDPHDRFVAAMNRKAATLGLKETHFANPHGLTAPGHHASARDLASLARAALADPVFATVVSTVQRGCTLVDAKGGRRDVVWTNTNRLLDTEGYDGVKTGTTSAAGNCLVASARRGESHRLVVILGAETASSRYVDARNLFRWAWGQGK